MGTVQLNPPLQTVCGLQSRHWSRVSYKAVIRMLSGAIVIIRLKLERSASRLMFFCVFCGGCFFFYQINFLLCCWPGSLSFLCLLAGSHLLFVVTQASPTQQFASSKPVSQEENRECQQDGSHSLDDLIMEVTSQHFCCSLFFGPVYTQGKGLHKGIYNKRWNHQETWQEIPAMSVNQFNFIFNGSHFASKICFCIKMSPLNSTLEQ